MTELDGDERAIAAAALHACEERCRQAEATIQYLNRVYAVLSGSNSAIVRAGTREEVFTEACRLAVKPGDFPLAWIGLVNPGEGNIVPVACAGDGSFVADAIKAHSAFDIGRDPFIAAAIYSRQAQICDVLSPDTDTLFGAEMLQRGRRSLVTLPLVNHGTTVACFILATDRRDAFDAAEMRLLSELSDNISFALDHIDKASRLTYLAYYDPLTGLANRALFLERLAQEISAARRDETQFGVIVTDLERFDSINAIYGRKKIDALLKEIGDRFSLSIGDPKAVACVAPKRFLAIIRSASPAEVIPRVFERNYQAWLGAPFAIDEGEVRISARAGLAVFPHDGTNADALLKNAEAALKASKTSGDRFVRFTKEISDKATERVSLETQLRRALSNHEFVLHYQPKVDIETRDMVGVEALIRWVNPELGLVSPAKFIPLMEESGMIIDVGTWALRQASEDRMSWSKRGLNAPRIAVNVSSVQVRRPDFVAALVNALSPQRAGAGRKNVAKAGIDIDVTESVLLERADANIEKLKELRGLGVGIAIDDFGTGYSPLAYLAKLPVGSFNIDRSFTATMLEDPNIMTLMSTLITLAHSLKLIVVAEGVELEEQAKILRLLRCDQMQGYLISKPLSFDAMTSYIERARISASAAV